MDDVDDRARLARRRPERTDLSTIRLFPRPGPKLYTFGVWWVFGLYVLFFAAAPYTPSAQDEQIYSEKMQQAIFSEDMRMAQQEAVIAQRSLDKVHVWGWRWRAPYDQLVPPRQQQVEMANARLREALAEKHALESEAKAAVGLWSSYGVDEVRERFWAAYQSGKDFAKRMTFWDVMLGVGGGSRDEELYVTLLRWLGQIMMNFTVGLISALFSFMFSLVSMIWEFKASYLSGLVFFLVAMSGASAMVATFIGGMYATAAGGVYALIQSSNNAARLEGRGARQHARVRHQYDQQQQQQYGGEQYERRPRYEHYD